MVGKAASGDPSGGGPSGGDPPIGQVYRRPALAIAIRDGSIIDQ